MEKPLILQKCDAIGFLLADESFTIEIIVTLSDSAIDASLRSLKDLLTLYWDKSSIRFLPGKAHAHGIIYGKQIPVFIEKVFTDLVDLKLIYPQGEWEGLHYYTTDPLPPKENPENLTGIEQFLHDHGEVLS